jgi:hypothetical protein
MIPDRPDFLNAMMNQAKKNRFDIDTNKSGDLNMLRAENNLMWKEMQDKI